MKLSYFPLLKYNFLRHNFGTWQPLFWLSRGVVRLPQEVSSHFVSHTYLSCFLEPLLLQAPVRHCFLLYQVTSTLWPYISAFTLMSGKCYRMSSLLYCLRPASVICWMVSRIFRVKLFFSATHTHTHTYTHTHTHTHTHNDNNNKFKKLIQEWINS